MATCAACNQTILFGGKQHGGRAFCSDKCVQAGAVLTVADNIPDSAVAPRVWEIHNGRCPKCSGPGPVDVHHSYRVWSGLVITSYSTRQNVCCHACANRARMKDAAFSLLFGWWGFPWGLIWTPIQLFRNVAAMVRSEQSTTPSPELAQLVRLSMAASTQQRPAAVASFASPR